MHSCRSDAEKGSSALWRRMASDSQSPESHRHLIVWASKLRSLADYVQCAASPGPGILRHGFCASSCVGAQKLGTASKFNNSICEHLNNDNKPDLAFPLPYQSLRSTFSLARLQLIVSATVKQELFAVCAIAHQGMQSRILLACCRQSLDMLRVIGVEGSLPLDKSCMIFTEANEPGVLSLPRAAEHATSNLDPVLRHR